MGFSGRPGARRRHDCSRRRSVLSRPGEEHFRLGGHGRLRDAHLFALLRGYGPKDGPASSRLCCPYCGCGRGTRSERALHQKSPRRTVGRQMLRRHRLDRDLQFWFRMRGPEGYPRHRKHVLCGMPRPRDAETRETRGSWGVSPLKSMHGKRAPTALPHERSCSVQQGDLPMWSHLPATRRGHFGPF